MTNNKEHENIVVDEGDTREARIYELGFHLDGDLPTEEAKKSYQHIKETISNVSTIVAEGEPTRIPLAYTISRGEQAGRRDFNTAYFCWIAYEADAEGHTAVLEAAHAEKKIIRYIDLKTTKEQAEHSQELAEVYARLDAEALEAEGEEEEVIDTEIDQALKGVDQPVVGAGETA